MDEAPRVVEGARGQRWEERLHTRCGFGGRVLSRRELGGFPLSETAYAAGTRMETHAHPDPYFCIVLRGSFRERFPECSRARETDHCAGEVIFHAAGDPHADVFLDRARCFNVELDPSALAGLPVRRSREVLCGAPVRRTLKELYREFASEAPSPLVVEGLVYQALGEAFERGELPARRTPIWLDHVRGEIRRRFDERLTVAELAAEVGVHPVHLSRAFRAHYDSSVPEYIRYVRVRAARDLLERSHLSLTEIAIATGFADQSHFTRIFKRLTGATPGRSRSRGATAARGRL